MENTQKIEKLSQVAHVSMDVARQALENNHWDLLDAMVELEKKGQTTPPHKSVQSTNYDQMPPLPSVQEVVDEKQKEYEENLDIGQQIRKWARLFFDFIRFNSFHIRKDEKDVLKIPVWVFVLIFLFAWHVTCIVLIVGLFFGLRYSFSGKDDMKVANDLMDQASNLAQKTKDAFKN